MGANGTIVRVHRGLGERGFSNLEERGLGEDKRVLLCPECVSLRTPDPLLLQSSSSLFKLSVYCWVRESVYTRDKSHFSVAMDQCSARGMHAGKADV